VDVKIFPFAEVTQKALAIHKRSPEAEIFQQWNCAHCGTKQTMEVPNKFYTHGICEVCDHLTNIEQDGCNFMLAMNIKRGA
jgi:hypothetical protein